MDHVPTLQWGCSVKVERVAERQLEASLQPMLPVLKPLGMMLIRHCYRANVAHFAGEKVAKFEEIG